MTPYIQYDTHGELQPEELNILLRSTNMGSYSIDQLKKVIVGSTTYVTARASGKLVGFGRMFTDQGTIAHINNMAVSPDFQRKGIGQTILEILIKVAGNVNSIYLFTNTADNLYLRNNFQQSEKRLYILKDSPKLP
jgi:N-acetylglutamate synthase-like GNAT family acetyltransferase